MGQVLFEPPAVAGWPGGASWLSSGTFFARVNFLDALLYNQRGPLAIPAAAGAASPEDAVDAVLARLVDANIAAASRDGIVAFARSISNPQNRAASVAYLVLGSPEYQLI